MCVPPISVWLPQPLRNLLMYYIMAPEGLESREYGRRDPSR
jgi:hypothetical protein